METLGMIIFYIIIFLFALVLMQDKKQDLFSALVISFFVIAFFVAMGGIIIEEIFLN